MLTVPAVPVNRRTLTRWRRLLSQLRHPDIELTVEEFAPLLSTFKQLRDAGHPFDFSTVVLMECLERQAIHTDDNIDIDGADDDSIGARGGVV